MTKPNALLLTSVQTSRVQRASEAFLSPFPNPLVTAEDWTEITITCCKWCWKHEHARTASGIILLPSSFCGRSSWGCARDRRPAPRDKLEKTKNK